MELKPSEKRFGEIAVDKGFATKDQINIALEIQAEEDSLEGQHRPLGRILHNLGYLNVSQIEEILATQEKAKENL
jgi:hypothetical protein